MSTFQKYEKFGAYHWDAYQNDPEYKAHVDHVVEWVQGDSILDAGAGDGLICAKLGAVGIDDNKRAVELATEKKANVLFCSVYDIVFDSSDFDAVFLGDVIEHLDRPKDALLEIHRVLQEGGRLYVVWPAVTDAHAIRHYSIPQLVKAVTECGFALQDDPYTIASRHYAVFGKVDGKKGKKK